jgi:hypothetical protein
MASFPRIGGSWFGRAEVEDVDEGFLSQENTPGILPD